MLRIIKNFQGAVIYKKQAMILLTILILGIGLYGSFEVVLNMFPVETDLSDSAMLWYGFHHYGLIFFKDWFYTPDNWLLSIISIHFFLFWIFGPKPTLVILGGWLIFIISLFLIGRVSKILRAPKTAIILPLILLFSGSYAHGHGYITYSIDHNISNLYGLLSFLICILWIKHQTNNTFVKIMAGCLFFIIVISGLSDPWLLPAYILPLIMTSFFARRMTQLPSERNTYKLLGNVLLAALIVAETKVFGLFHFLPGLGIKIANWQDITSNIYFFIKNLGGLLNILPTTISFSSAAISSSIFLYLVLNAVLLGWKKSRPQSILLFSLTLIILSTFMMFFSFILLKRQPKGDYSTRFLTNFLFLWPLLISLMLEFYWNTASWLYKTIALLTATLFVSSGVLSNLSAWKSPRLTANEDNVMQFIHFFQKNNLNYGYGPYWGSNANAVTWLSNERIIIRPVIFSTSTGFISTGVRALSSKLWQFSEFKQPFFVVIATDPEQCSNFELCLKGVKKQFGSPEKILQYQDKTIYVYQHPPIT